MIKHAPRELCNKCLNIMPSLEAVIADNIPLDLMLYVYLDPVNTEECVQCNNFSIPPIPFSEIGLEKISYSERPLTRKDNPWLQ